MKYTIYFLLVLGLASLLYGCANKNAETNGNSKSAPMDPNAVLSADTTLIIMANNLFTDYYSFLKASNPQKCLALFKPELLVAPGEKALSDGLSARNSVMGIPIKFEIMYNFVDITSKADTIYYFFTRVYSDKDKVCYEKFGMDKAANGFLIGLYEYSPVPYWDIKSANDSKSELNRLLKKLYDLINKKDAKAAVEMADISIIEQNGKDALINMLTEQFRDFKKVTEINVKLLDVRLEKDFPKIDLEIEVKDESGQVFVDRVGLMDRDGLLKIVDYQRMPKSAEGNSAEVSITKEELGRFKKEVGNFYQNLTNNDFEAILKKIDKAVFKTNDYNTVKNSFVMRNEYYGTPVDTKKTAANARKEGDKLIVDFLYEVTNSKGQKSYERISIMSNNSGEFFLNGYDYSDKPLK